MITRSGCDNPPSVNSARRAKACGPTVAARLRLLAWPLDASAAATDASRTAAAKPQARKISTDSVEGTEGSAGPAGGPTAAAAAPAAAKGAADGCPLLEAAAAAAAAGPAGVGWRLASCRLFSLSESLLALPQQGSDAAAASRCFRPVPGRQPAALDLAAGAVAPAAAVDAAAVAAASEAAMVHSCALYLSSIFKEGPRAAAAAPTVPAVPAAAASAAESYSVHRGSISALLASLPLLLLPPLPPASATSPASSESCSSAQPCCCRCWSAQQSNSSKRSSLHGSRQGAERRINHALG